MVLSELLNLQKIIKTTFSAMDNYYPGDEDIEDEITEASKWLGYAISSLQDHYEEVGTTIEKLCRAQEVICNKLKNPYYEPNYEHDFN